MAVDLFASKTYAHFMSKAFSVFLFASFFCTSSLAQKENPPGHQKEILQGLAREDYFTLASCCELADTLLARVGLPEIGKTSPIQGRRTGYDRSKQLADLPVFNDGVTAPDRTRIKIVARAKKPSHWTVTLERAHGADKLTTLLDFEKRDASSRVCDLTSIRYLTGAPAKPLAGFTSIMSCLQIFAGKDPSEENGNPAKIFTWMKEDCAFALHYSKQAREAAQVP